MKWSKARRAAHSEMKRRWWAEKMSSASKPAPAPFSDDSVNHPVHYTQHPSKVECIDITEHMGFCLGNAIKYIWRCDTKGGVKDLEKAIWYINREIARRKL